MKSTFSASSIARLGQVADAALGHDRDRHRLLDLADLGDGRHARDSPVAPDVGGHALERHDRGRARRFGDPRLLGVDDVHDDAALQHLGQTHFDSERFRSVRHAVVPPLRPSPVSYQTTGAEHAARDLESTSRTASASRSMIPARCRARRRARRRGAGSAGPPLSDRSPAPGATPTPRRGRGLRHAAPGDALAADGARRADSRPPRPTRRPAAGALESACDAAASRRDSTSKARPRRALRSAPARRKRGDGGLDRQRRLEVGRALDAREPLDDRARGPRSSRCGIPGTRSFDSVPSQTTRSGRARGERRDARLGLLVAVLDDQRAGGDRGLEHLLAPRVRAS